MDINHKNIVITGGSSGIGLALTKLFLKKKCRVFSFDIREPQESLEGMIVIHVDITDETQVRNGLRQVDGLIDVLINNAGIMRRGALFASSVVDFDALFSVNVKGSWLMFRESLPFLQRNAMIVQMCSRHALFPPKDAGLYGLTKQTAQHLAEHIARDFPQFTVKTLFPGPVDTEGVGRYGVTGKVLEEKVKHMATAEYVAQLILDLMESDKTKLLFNNKMWEYSMV